MLSWRHVVSNWYKGVQEYVIPHGMKFWIILGGQLEHVDKQEYFIGTGRASDMGHCIKDLDDDLKQFMSHSVIVECEKQIELPCRFIFI